MARGRVLAVVITISLLANAFCVPVVTRIRRTPNKELDVQNEVIGLNRNSRDADSSFSNEDEPAGDSSSSTTTTTIDPFDDDDDFSSEIGTSSSSSGGGGGGGSNIFSLLRLAGALFPASGGNNIPKNKTLQTPNSKTLQIMRNMIQQYINRNRQPLRRQDIIDNIINIEYFSELKPPFQRIESDEDDNQSSSSSDSDEDNAAEESVETNDDKNSKQDESNGNGDNSDEFDSDEPPEGDGQGGGILGLLAGLSGGENGESDLGSLLATVSGIVGSLSGEGFDLNALIASGLGLFVGLLSEGDENPGAVLASYLLTSLDSLTGGGAKNNGAFFGTFLSKLVKGTSAAETDGSSEENGDGEGEKMKDSAGFFMSFLMSLLGDMSKGSSTGSKTW